MSINPIDIMRTQEASQVKHIESQRLQYAHEQSQNNFQKMVQQEQHKPTQMTKSDNDEYRYNAKDKGNNQYQNLGSKKKNKNKEDKNTSKEPHINGGIDILI
ncbi:MAG: hypothetical protein PHF63_02755 [Herbinix sp.]|nr:hypothetical protein [Herbinix sp.]